MKYEKITKIYPTKIEIIITIKTKNKKKHLKEQNIEKKDKNNRTMLTLSL